MIGLEGIPSWLVSMIVGAQGVNGVILLMFWVTMVRNERYRREDRDQVSRIMAEHKEYMDRQARMYENNVQLLRDTQLMAKGYERLAGDLAGIITLNTQSQTRLVERIDHNMFCPLVREKGPHA